MSAAFDLEALKRLRGDHARAKRVADCNPPAAWLNVARTQALCRFEGVKYAPEPDGTQVIGGIKIYIAELQELDEETP